MKRPETLVVIDGKSVLYRGYYAMGDLATADGRPTGATYGFAMMGLRILQEFNPDYVAVAWDKSKTNIRARRELYAQYKANRKPMPEDLREQIPDVRRVCRAFGWPLLEVDDYEADDIMGSLAVQAKQKDIDSVLVTGDLDVLQLVNHHTQVCLLKRGVTQTITYNQNSFQEAYRMTPEQFTDYKALMGDPSDNIPGVSGVGEKTARNLIAEYGSLDGVYQHLDDIGGATAKKLATNRDMAFLSRQLIELHLDAPVAFDDVAADAGGADPEAVDALFEELNFHRLRSELPAPMQPAKTPSYKAEDSPSADEQQHIAVYRDRNPDFAGDQAVVFTLEDYALLSVGEDACYLLPRADIPDTVSIIGYHAKEDLKKLPAGASVEFDVMIAAFLLNPLLRQQELSALAKQELGISMDEPGRRDDMTDETARLLTYVLRGLYNRYRQQLEEFPRIHSVATDIEWPLLPVLARMEEYGMKLDVGYLAAMSRDFAERLGDLETQIYEQAGEEFNINSPQQLQTVLFETLQLPTDNIKRTQTGYSTGAAELEKLRDLHPIIELIFRHRELTKLKNTYIDALPEQVDSRNRLHTTFTQTVTQTGRLSSLEPNLQNIPVRSEEGKAIRRAFIAEEGNLLLQADYSQFELRLAAALSGDKAMIDSFNSGVDIHTQTAAELYGVELDEVTKQQRYNAKTVNFGVMYGMSPHGLHVATGMSREDAKAFIDQYFQLRSGLLEYLDALKTQAKQDGYVETWFGRRRPMPDIHSSNFAVRSAAERAAINMPIQGTEADLMKLAMIEADKALEPECRQILQIHDSILVECPQDWAEQATSALKSSMERIAPQDLPLSLEVETSSGKHWGEL
ncbi:DNA polymerase I [Candidatus Saccharibacteria bacterium QS_5_54_17]|nr:MAG: DNA polymerase I [Candidatus Saccharibacteria bacterium QS_5_54_17]